MLENEIIGGFQFVIGKWTENGAGFGDVLDEQFVGEIGEQRFHGGSLQGVNVFNILGTQKMFGLEAVVRSAHDPSGSSEGINLQEPCEA